MKDYWFIRKWKKEMKEKVKLISPNYDDDKLDNYLEEIIQKRFKDHPCTIRNTYRDVTANTSLLNILEYIHKEKPVMGGYGVLFKNHHQIYNPNAHMLLDSIQKRKAIKKDRKNYDKRSYEFLVRDIAQLNEKVIANSFYGANGTKTSTFYNRDLASSVTATGQAEIATAETSFEALMSNNTKFYDLDECLLFINRIINEDYKYDIDNIADAQNVIYERLMDTMMYPLAIDKDKLRNVVSNLTDEQCTRIYYKNNLIAFFQDYKPVREIMHKLINKTKTFRNPNEIPDKIKDDLEQVWKYVKCFCVYNYTTRNRIIRDKYHGRKTCVTQDTDSTMLTLNNLMKVFIDEFADEEVAAENQDEFDFILVNIICYLLTEYSKVFFGRYCTDVNIPEDYHWMINMKNEYYYPILLDTDSKKHYITLTKLQEGQEINPPKIEIHGLEMAKAETSLITKDFFFNIIQDDIMYTDKIDVAKIIRKIEKFKHTIRKSLEEGKLEFLPLKSVKEVAAYDTPYSEQGIRAVRSWNFLYPDMQINLPDKILGLRLSCEKQKQLDAAMIPGDKRKLIQENIFDSEEKSIRTNGFNIIAIPQNLERIPEWLIPIIDYDKMIEDNVSKFNAILKSLGAVTLKTRATSNHMSNIITF